MPTAFRPYQPDQLLMLPENLQDWLPAGPLARIGTMSIDGTKVRANASERKAMSYGRMVKQEKRLEVCPIRCTTWQQE